MNYQRIYNQIIDRAKTRKLEGYKEKHHIIPKCMGGGNEKENLVELTAREHFICHWLLSRIYPENAKIIYAFWAMCNQKNAKQKQRHISSSRAYQEAKKVFSELHSKTRRGYNHSTTAREKMSIAGKGKPKSVIHRENIKKYAQKRTGEHKEKIRQGKTGIPCKETTKQKIRESLYKTRQAQNWSSNLEKRILQFRENELIHEYKSIAEAKRITGITTIGDCLAKRQKTGGGFIWKYKDQ